MTLISLDRKQYFIDSFGLIAIGVPSLGYILFSVPFAEFHIRFSFLDFPIFIGEILLFICLTLFFVKYLISPTRNLNKWHYLLIVYFAFVVIKALYGYFTLGPLSFRNAALLYYPMFAVLGYCFYRRDFFEGEKIFLLGALVILLFIDIAGQTYVIYWALSSSLLALVFVNLYPNKRIKYFLLISILIVIPYKWFFLTSRMMLVSNIVTGLYLMTAFFTLSKLKRQIKVLMVMLGILFFVLGILKFANPVRVKSLIAFREMIEVFNRFDAKVQERKAYFKTRGLGDIKLYRPEGQLPVFTTRYSEFRRRQEEEFAKAGLGKIIQDFTQKDLNTGFNNAVFRLFIWRDMLVELAQQKPILGFSFGKPLRSMSLEILYWGWHDWGLNGWVPAHNSYLHIIYRAGVVGILFLVTVSVVLFKMVKEFIHQKSIIGILLCGVIINWFVAANFLLIFELPYTAIPIWSLYGITLAYCHEQKKLKHELAK